MSTLFVRILFLLALVPVGAAAAPRPDHAPGDTVAVAATARERAACLHVEADGDRVSKLRVYNPKLGVAFRYSF